MTIKIHNMLFSSLTYGLFSGRLHEQSIFYRHYFPSYSILHSNPPCQLSLWEETGEPGENTRLSAEC